MKKHHFSLLILIVGMLSSVNSHTIEHNFLGEQHNCFLSQIDDKIYLDPRAIIIQNNSVYLNMGGKELLPVSGLFSDANGIYISKKRESEKRGEWECPVCGHVNSGNSPICEKVAFHFVYEPENR